MFRKKTVFIVGAGGSKELGLPIGSELTDIIAEKLTLSGDNSERARSFGDRRIAEAIHQILSTSTPRDSNPYISACRNIARAMPQSLSIDNYLHTHYENPRLVQMGKIAITASILDAEQNCPLYIDDEIRRTIDFKSTKDVWHNTFCKMLTENVQLSDLDGLFENVSFITFNYDRCIEQYIYLWLESYMLISRTAAQELMSQLKIIHPYGQVGKLPWQPGSMRAVPFGDKVSGVELPEIASNIRTFTERVIDDSVPEQMKELISNAKQVVYLGFSFGDMNMQLMKPESCTVTKNSYGTSLGISGPNMEFITKKLVRDFSFNRQNYMHGTHFPEFTCAKFLNDYSRVLTG